MTSSQGFDFDDGSPGDIELGLAFGLHVESDQDGTSLLPTITVEGGLSLPTGDESDELGAGKIIGHGGVALTKSFGSLYATANIEFGIAKDIREYEYGFGLLYLLGESGWGVAVELEGKIERELDENETERVLHIIPSTTFTWSDTNKTRWQFGFGALIGLTALAENSDKIGAILQLQTEF